MVPEFFFVFDVESIGLHGEGFAVGFVVVDKNGCQIDAGLFSCEPEAARGNSAGFDWVSKNVPNLPNTHLSTQGVRHAFWLKWLEWQKQGAFLVADCGWPVEARFLASCVDDHPVSREWQGPYPFYDLSSFLLAMGKNPLETLPRLKDELPIHNPLADAKQSARILIETIKMWVNPSK